MHRQHIFLLCMIIFPTILHECRAEVTNAEGKIMSDLSADKEELNALNNANRYRLKQQFNNYNTKEKPKELIQQCFLTEGGILSVNGIIIETGNGALLGSESRINEEYQTIRSIYFEDNDDGSVGRRM